MPQAQNQSGTVPPTQSAASGIQYQRASTARIWSPVHYVGSVQPNAQLSYQHALHTYAQQLMYYQHMQPRMQMPVQRMQQQHAQIKAPPAKKKEVIAIVDPTKNIHHVVHKTKEPPTQVSNKSSISRSQNAVNKDSNVLVSWIHVRCKNFAVCANFTAHAMQCTKKRKVTTVETMFECAECVAGIHLKKTATEPARKRLKLSEGYETKTQAKKTFAVAEWNFMSILRWLNRVRESKYIGIHFYDLRESIFISRMKGSELCNINVTLLRMHGIMDHEECDDLLSCIEDLINKGYDDLITDNEVEESAVTREHTDAFTFEMLKHPVVVKQSGKVYERSFVKSYIKQFHTEPMTGVPITLQDLDPFHTATHLYGL